MDIQTGAGENRLLDFIKRNLLATGPAVKTFELLSLPAVRTEAGARGRVGGPARFPLASISAA